MRASLGSVALITQAFIFLTRIPSLPNLVPLSNVLKSSNQTRQGGDKVRVFFLENLKGPIAKRGGLVRWMINQFILIFQLLLPLFFTSCIWIPAVTKSHTVSDNDLNSILIGHSTKNDVYKILGKPNCLERGKYCVYEVEYSYGTLSYLSGSLFADTTSDLGGIQYRIVFKFDQNKILRDYDIEKGLQKYDDIRKFPIEEESTPLNVKKEILLWENPNPDETGWPPLISASSCELLLAVNNRSQGEIWLINRETMEKVNVKSSEDIIYFKLSPDGRYLAAVSDFIKVTDIVTQRQVSTFKGHGTRKYQWHWISELDVVLDFFPDGNTIASGGHDGFVRVWETITGFEINSFKAYKESVLAIAVSPHGSMIATAGDTGIILWDSLTGNELDRINVEGDTNYLSHGLKFSPNGTILAVNKGSHVELIRINQKQRNFESLEDVFLLPFAGNSKPTRPWHYLDYSRDGRYIAASNGSAVVWDVERKRKIWRYVPTIPRYTGWSRYKSTPGNYFPTIIYAIALSRDKNELVVTTTEGVKTIKMQPPKLDSPVAAKAFIAPTYTGESTEPQRVVLRHQPEKVLTASELLEAIKVYGFFDSQLNPDGLFRNDFRDNQNGTVTDLATGLMWQKYGSVTHLKFRAAEKYIRGLNGKRYAGYSDWRMPTMEELASLLQKDKYGGVYLDSVFYNRQIRCWSSDRAETMHGPPYATTVWVIDYHHGKARKAHGYNPPYIPKENGWTDSYIQLPDNYVRAVRLVK